MNSLGFLRVLPLLILVAILAFSVRLADVVTGVSHLSGAAFAAEDAGHDEEGHGAGSGGDKAADHGEEPDATVSPPQGEGAADAGEKTPIVFEDNTARAPEWRDAGDSDLDTAAVSMELYEDLATRRKELDKMQQDLQVKEALLKAAEQELDRKYQELTKLRGEIESLLGKQTEEEQKQITSLVKVYEGMKPKDAARIFDTLDIDVLVQVVSQMSERKLSPVLAAMNPERARTITIMLAEQKTLPVLPKIE